MQADPLSLPDLQATQVALALHQRAVRRACATRWVTCTLPARAIGVLLHIRARGAMTVGQVRAACHLTGPATSAVIDQLARQGLVVRAEDPADRRRTLVRLTPAGTALIDGLLTGTEQCWREWFECLRHGELHALIAGLEALTASLSGAVATASEVDR